MRWLRVPIMLLAMLALGPQCRRTPPPAVAIPIAQPVQDTAAAPLPLDATVVDLFAHATVTGTEPPVAQALASLLVTLRLQAREPNLGKLAEHLTAESLRTLQMDGSGPLLVPPSTVWDRLEPEIAQVEFNGGRAAIVNRHRSLPLTSWFFLRKGRWLWELADNRELQPPWPNAPDVQNRPLSLAQALTDIAGNGAPELVFTTSAGTFSCQLHADLVPELVAHVVGLATGKRASRKIVERKFTNQWHFVRLYDNQLIYKPLAGQRIESGDPFGHGTGHAGFRIRDVFDLRLRHNRPGVISLVSLGPHSTSSMWQVILQPMPHLDDRAAVFGQCSNLDVVDKISRLAQNSVRIDKVTVRRLPL